MNTLGTIVNLARHRVRWIQAHLAVDRWHAGLTNATIVTVVGAMHRSGMAAFLGRTSTEPRLHLIALRLRWLMAAAALLSSLACNVTQVAASEVTISIVEKIRRATHIFMYVEGQNVEDEIVHSTLYPSHLSLDDARRFKLCRKLSWNERPKGHPEYFVAFLVLDGKCLQPVLMGNSGASLMRLPEGETIRLERLKELETLIRRVKD